MKKEDLFDAIGGLDVQMLSGEERKNGALAVESGGRLPLLLPLLLLWR